MASVGPRDDNGKPGENKSWLPTGCPARVEGTKDFSTFNIETPTNYPDQERPNSMSHQSICFLVSSLQSFEKKNTLLLANASLRQGHSVSLCLINSLSLTPEGMFSLGAHIQQEINDGDSINRDHLTFIPFASFDLIWVMSFGDRELFLDTIELLWLLELKIEFVNSAKSLIFLNNKYLCGGYVKEISSARSFVSSSPEFLGTTIRGEDIEEWIVKPPAESMGRGVLALNKGDSNTNALLEFLSNFRGRRYLVLQERIKIKEHKEKRVLIANGTLVLAYQKNPMSGEHRSNIHAGAKPELTQLSAEEFAVCENAWRWCASHGAKFLGIDMIGTEILEINVVNPGGLNTYFDLSGKDHSKHVIKAILAQQAHGEQRLTLLESNDEM